MAGCLRGGKPRPDPGRDLAGHLGGADRTGVKARQRSRWPGGGIHDHVRAAAQAEDLIGRFHGLAHVSTLSIWPRFVLSLRGLPAGSLAAGRTGGRLGQPRFVLSLRGCPLVRWRLVRWGEAGQPRFVLSSRVWPCGSLAAGRNGGVWGGGVGWEAVVRVFMISNGF